LYGAIPFEFEAVPDARASNSLSSIKVVIFLIVSMLLLVKRFSLNSKIFVLVETFQESPLASTNLTIGKTNRIKLNSNKFFPIFIIFLCIIPLILLNYSKTQ